MMKHLACIMDGNRRWARKQGLAAFLGHQQGVDAVKMAIQYCKDHAISYLSLYTFSLENFKRSEEEKSFLFSLLARGMRDSLQEFVASKVRVRFVGDRSMFPESVRATIESVEQQTDQYNNLQVNFLFCYGGRQEIISCVKSIAQQVQDGVLMPAMITQETIEQHLWTAGIPAPDLVIRTGGVRRLSNFLLYQAAYAELYFTDTLWPDFSRNELEKAVEWFKQSQRNFGA